MKKFLVCAAALGICFMNAAAWAADNAIGTWRAIDDETGVITSIVKTELVNGQLQGTVLKIIPVPGVETLTHCKLCTDSRKDQPIVGMKVITGLRQDSPGHWSGGEILDPDEGRVYQVKVSSEDGRTLTIQAYIGFALISRTEIWLRD